MLHNEMMAIRYNNKYPLHHWRKCMYWLKSWVRYRPQPTIMLVKKLLMYSWLFFQRSVLMAWRKFCWIESSVLISFRAVLIVNIHPNLVRVEIPSTDVLLTFLNSKAQYWCCTHNFVDQRCTSTVPKFSVVENVCCSLSESSVLTIFYSKAQW